MDASFLPFVKPVRQTEIENCVDHILINQNPQGTYIKRMTFNPAVNIRLVNNIRLNETSLMVNQIDFIL